LRKQDLPEESNNKRQIRGENSKNEPRRLHVIVLSGLGALLCVVAAILSFMGDDAALIESGSLQVYNLTFLVGTAAFACFLVSMISQKRNWGAGGASWVKAGALVFLFLMFCLIFVFREPASLAVEWNRVSPVDEAVHYQYRVQSNYDSRHAIGNDRVRNVSFFGSSRSFHVVAEGEHYASCLSSGDACALRECPTGQIWWVGGLQWGTEVVRDADASGETKALAYKPVDAKTITLESYDEYGYRYEYE
jgi:hypothetical protein